MPNDDRAAVQAGVDVKVMLTFRLAEALGYDDPILDFDDLVERARALAAPSPAVDREALAKIMHVAEHRPHECPWPDPNADHYRAADALLARYDIRERGAS